MRSSVSGAASRVDAGLYALFSRHADRKRHDVDRDRYRGTTLSVGFETYLARLYALSWLVCVAVAASLLSAGIGPSTPVFGPVATAVAPAFVTPNNAVLVPVALLALLAKRGTLAVGGAYLRWRANARRVALDRALPGAVRYLRILADGSGDRHTMVRKLADQEAYGEINAAFERVLEIEALTGSLDDGLRRVARETPSRELLSPFLLKFREHTNRPPESLGEYLRTESRMLSRQRSRARRRVADYRSLLAELFVFLLVAPALVAVAATAATAAVPGFARPSPVSVPLSGPVSLRGAVAYASAGFVLVVGAVAALLIAQLRPPDHVRAYERPTGRATLATATTNPASAGFVFAFPAVVVAWSLWLAGASTTNVLLSGYAAYGFPVGAVAVKREQRDDARDRELHEFVHAVAGHVGRGTPFDEAVESAAGGMRFGAIRPEIADLVFRLGLTAGGAERDARTDALDRFAAGVGTPLAAQTVGLVTGALEVGSDVETTFETLRSEIGSLHYGRKELHSAMRVYVLAAWVVALLLVGGVLAVTGYAFGQHIPVPTEPAPPDADRIAEQLYLVTQATMLGCGWFAGAASRGRYEALLHSSALVVVCYIAFAGAGIV